MAVFGSKCIERDCFRQKAGKTVLNPRNSWLKIMKMISSLSHISTPFRHLWKRRGIPVHRTRNTPGRECMMHLREFAVANGYCAHSPARIRKCPCLRATGSRLPIIIPALEAPGVISLSIPPGAPSGFSNFRARPGWIKKPFPFSASAFGHSSG